MRNDFLRTLPLGSAAPDQEQKLYARQRLELDRRAAFVRTYQRNRGEPGFQTLDPVLAYHLGLSSPKK